MKVFNFKNRSIIMSNKRLILTYLNINGTNNLKGGALKFSLFTNTF